MVVNGLRNHHGLWIKRKVTKFLLTKTIKLFIIQKVLVRFVVTTKANLRS